MDKFVLQDQQLPQPIDADKALSMTGRELDIPLMPEICSTGVYMKIGDGTVSLSPPARGMQAYTQPLAELAAQYGWDFEADKEWVRDCIGASLFFPSQRSIKSRYARGEFKLAEPREDNWAYPFLLQGISVWLRYREQGDTLGDFIGRLKARMNEYICLFDKDKFDVGLFCYLFMAKEIPELPERGKEFFCFVKGFPQFAQWDNSRISTICREVAALNRQDTDFADMMNAIGGETPYLLESDYPTNPMPDKRESLFSLTV